MRALDDLGLRYYTGQQIGDFFLRRIFIRNRFIKLPVDQTDILQLVEKELVTILQSTLLHEIQIVIIQSILLQFRDRRLHLFCKTRHPGLAAIELQLLFAAHQYAAKDQDLSGIIQDRPRLYPQLLKHLMSQSFKADDIDIHDRMLFMSLNHGLLHLQRSLLRHDRNKRSLRLRSRCAHHLADQDFTGIITVKACKDTKHRLPLR